MLFSRRVKLLFLIILPATLAIAQPSLPLSEPLYQLSEGRTYQADALWVENSAALQFSENTTCVVIADLKGPGIISMIHFALPESLTLDRQTRLRISWDGETTPSVDTPLVDFFCDPNGALTRVDTALVNKNRGWNSYIPMPFEKSARVEVETATTSTNVWHVNPCYSYVMYRKLDKLPPGSAYFHASFQERQLLLGKEDYTVLDTAGRGQFIGWNTTVRVVGGSLEEAPVDENVKFYVDSETTPSVQWQGIEDSFGFSWGFPPTNNGFQYTGFQAYLNGFAAYRFMDRDRIPFVKSLKMVLGYGANEGKTHLVKFGAPENRVEISSVAYWYQERSQ